MITDENGNGSITESIASGRTYYVKEISSPRGFLMDESVYAVTPEGKGDAAAVIESVEIPVNDPIAVTLTKSSSTGSVLSLEGIEFTIKYYDEDPDTDLTAHDLEKLVPKRTWTVKVKGTLIEGETVYRTLLSPEYLTENSDGLYLSENGETILPVGYFTVRETKAADGYTLDDAKYYSKGVLISENNMTVVGKVDFDGNINPEGINTVMFSVLDDPVESPETGDTGVYGAIAVISLAVLAGYLDYDARKNRK